MKIIKDGEIKEISENIFGMFEFLGWKEIKEDNNLSKISDVEPNSEGQSPKKRRSPKGLRPNGQRLQKEQSSR